MLMGRKPLQATLVLARTQLFMISMALAPLSVARLRQEVDALVTASDASEAVGVVTYSERGGTTQ